MNVETLIRSIAAVVCRRSADAPSVRVSIHDRDGIPRRRDYTTAPVFFYAVR